MATSQPPLLLVTRLRPTQVVPDTSVTVDGHTGTLAVSNFLLPHLRRGSTLTVRALGTHVCIETPCERHFCAHASCGRRVAAAWPPRGHRVFAACSPCGRRVAAACYRATAVCDCVTQVKGLDGKVVSKEHVRGGASTYAFQLAEFARRVREVSRRYRTLQAVTGRRGAGGEQA